MKQLIRAAWAKVRPVIRSRLFSLGWIICWNVFAMLNLVRNAASEIWVLPILGVASAIGMIATYVLGMRHSDEGALAVLRDANKLILDQQQLIESYNQQTVAIPFYFMAGEAQNIEGYQVGSIRVAISRN